MQPEFHSGAVTRPLGAYLRLAMMGCPTLRARGELIATTIVEGKKACFVC